MTPVLERTFRVRHYECDAYGHLNHANYLRYMQEAAFDASADVGYAVEDYEAMGRLWLARESDITYYQPLRYGDSVTVRTWVADVRRVRSWREYELRRPGSEGLVARASTEWVFLDAASLRPTSVPAQMAAAFRPDDAPPPKRDPFPAPSPRPTSVFSIIRPVEWRDIDPAMHVNNAVYLSYIEECGVRVAAEFGWPMSRIVANGFGIVARRYRIRYLQPALLGDEVKVSTWVADVKRATAVRHYTVERAADGELLARAHVLWVWVDLEREQPIRIPANFLADFEPNIYSAAGT